MSVLGSRPTSTAAIYLQCPLCKQCWTGAEVPVRYERIDIWLDHMTVIHPSVSLKKARPTEVFPPGW